MSRPIRPTRPMMLWGATARSGAAVLLALGILAAPRLGVSATVPSGRYQHTAILDSLRHRMLMFGGTSGTALSNELWALSLGDAPGWQLVSTPAAPYRAAQVAILDPVRDRMVVFGGGDPFGQRRNDVWVFPLAQNGPWSQLAVAGTPPAPRTLHCGIYDPIRDRLIVFGGYKGSDNLNDVWVLSLSGTPTWTEILPSGTAPSPRRECSAVYDPVRDRMIVIGGVGGGNGYFNDTWALSLDGSPQWTQLDAGTSGLLPRSGHSAVYDPVRDLIWLFGGRDFNQVFHNDLWTLSLSGAPTWAQVSPNGNLPGARAYHSAVIDPSSDRMVIFADTWFLQLTGVPTWLAISPPQFLVPIASPVSFELGQTFSVTVTAWNAGLDTDDGRISVSFPALTDPADGQWVEGTTTGNPSAVVELPVGTSLVSSTCQPLAASCLAVEYRDVSWTKPHDLTLTVRPRAAGTFYFYVRATMHVRGTSCLQINGLPAEGELGFVDQQGFPVTRYAVTVHQPPIPRFRASVAGIPSILQLGQSFTLTASARNDGGTSDDGRIVVSFPALTQLGDEEWATSPSAGDSPGYVERPVGSGLQHANCQTMVGGYLAAEYADDSWLGDGAEMNDLVLTVTPQGTGTFYVDVRATMHSTAATGCAYVNVLPDSGGTIVVDQQGWPVTRYAVQVLPPTLTTVWSRITPPPGGPSPRFSTSVVYHPGRDALVFYGGSDGTYRYLTDSWVLDRLPVLRADVASVRRG